LQRRSPHYGRRSQRSGDRDAAGPA
jgi:hypothetical protein